MTLLPPRRPDPDALPPSSELVYDSTFVNALALHQAKMKYAWDWFQYHADQRLKAFNYFVVVLGILIAAYGAAIKEVLTITSRYPRPYEVFACAVAVCGAVISFAFLLIEVRNTELVECGRRWLDKLEQELRMRLREDDRERRCLPTAGGWLTGRIRPDSMIKHRCWIRFIYGMACLGFVIAVICALYGFK